MSEISERIKQIETELAEIPIAVDRRFICEFILNGQSIVGEIINGDIQRTMYRQVWDLIFKKLKSLWGAVKTASFFCVIPVYCRFFDPICFIPPRTMPEEIKRNPIRYWSLKIFSPTSRAAKRHPNNGSANLMINSADSSIFPTT